MYAALLKKLTSGSHKYEIHIFRLDGERLIPLSKVKFGARGYGDYTLGTTDEQKKSYIARHKNNEDWTISGYSSAGFWSRWILWNKRTIPESIKDIHKRFSNIKVFYS
jgi:hypothetical protein